MPFQIISKPGENKMCNKYVVKFEHAVHELAEKASTDAPSLTPAIIQQYLQESRCSD